MKYPFNSEMKKCDRAHIDYLMKCLRDQDNKLLVSFVTHHPTIQSMSLSYVVDYLYNQEDHLKFWKGRMNYGSGKKLSN